MSILLLLIPLALLLGVIALIFFFWAQRSGQFNDPDGDAARILRDDDLLEKDQP
jgi:cbb3-type cytochrome oxidase maturation protein